jgi:hypothetical protein
VNTREIRTSTNQASCDVCGRTLLRGERAEIYLSGGTRRSVCELCTSRALHGGWVREGEVPAYDESAARSDRRRSLFGRRRNRRDVRSAQNGSRSVARDPIPEPEPELDDVPRSAPASRSRPSRAQPASPSWPAPVRAAGRIVGGSREPRHVRAVPTSIEHKISSAVSLFNDSEHPRTVAGIARSLGLPDVSVHPSDVNSSVVNVIVSWELCWYRYEMDLSDELPAVRVAGQGYELSELSEIERQNNAVADERGRLDLGA